MYDIDDTLFGEFRNSNCIRSKDHMYDIIVHLFVHRSQMRKNCICFAQINLFIADIV